MKTPSGDLNERQISPLEAAFSHTNIPWPTSGVIPLWGLGGEPRGHKWPDCCRFMVRPESQSQWLILRHGSINVILADVGLTATDKTWHHEQWLHLKFAGRKRRRDASPADSKSRQRNCAANQQVTDPRRTCASGKVAIGHLRRPVEFAVVAGMFCSFLCHPWVTKQAVSSLSSLLMANDWRRWAHLWDQRCPLRCILQHALRKLCHTALARCFAQKCRCSV